MKKVVLKLDFHDNKCRQKAMQTASGVSGVESVAMDKDKKLTLTGVIDPVKAVTKLRKLCHTEIVSVGLAKEPEKKKEEPKKEEKKDKKEDPKKDKKEDPKTDKKEDPKKNQQKEVIVTNPYPPVAQYYPPVPYCYAYGKSIEEDPAGCIIC